MLGRMQERILELAERRPRVTGCGLMGVAALLVMVNGPSIVDAGRFFPMFFPLAGMIAAAGVVPLLTGVPPSRLRHSQLSWVVSLLVVAGLATGFVMNRLIAGVWG